MGIAKEGKWRIKDDTLSKFRKLSTSSEREREEGGGT
jgi:hypothetical protein